MKNYIKLKLSENLLNNKPMMNCAGVLIKSIDTGNILLLLRNDYPIENTWSMLAGKIEIGESDLEGLKREVNEELSINPDIIKYRFMAKELNLIKNVNFSWYVGLTDKEFIPKLDEENLDYGWFNINNLPNPLYPGTLDKIKML